MERITGLVYGPDFHFHRGTLILENGKIREFPADGDPAVSEAGSAHSGLEECRTAEKTKRDPDGSGEGKDEECYVIPGLVDIHFHGCMGEDFCDGSMEAIRTIAKWEASSGVTSICSATLTLPKEHLKKVLSLAAAFAAEQEAKKLPGDYADLVGINMEGPFISHVKKGAQNEKYILPCDDSICMEFLEASEGLVRIIGLAPEENPGFETYIKKVKEHVRVSLAHTNADYETAMRAFRAGACHAVHLFNAMPEMTHREPGVVGAVRENPHVMAELICDGNHVHPAMVRAAFAMLGDERIVLISDSLRAAGLGDGEILLGGQKVLVKGTRATLEEGGNLAGSVTSLTDCMRIAVSEMGIPLESAVRCATWNAAKAIGAEDRCGVLLPGRKADLVILRKDLSIKAVLKEGRRICSAE